MNLNKAERLVYLLEKMVKVQNQSRSSYQYEVDNACTEMAKQVKVALLENEPAPEEPMAF